MNIDPVGGSSFNGVLCSFVICAKLPLTPPARSSTTYSHETNISPLFISNEDEDYPTTSTSKVRLIIQGGSRRRLSSHSSFRSANLHNFFQSLNLKRNHGRRRKARTGSRKLGRHASDVIGPQSVAQEEGLNQNTRIGARSPQKKRFDTERRLYGVAP